MLGTRGLADLPSHIRPATGSERHVELQPLERSAVLRLCADAGLEELGEHIATLSGGHPLLVRMYMRLAEERDPGDRDEALAMMPPGDGEVWTFYETVSDALADQPETLELLGLISRLRGPTRRSSRLGSPRPVVRPGTWPALIASATSLIPAIPSVGASSIPRFESSCCGARQIAMEVRTSICIERSIALSPIAVGSRPLGPPSALTSFTT